MIDILVDKSEKLNNEYSLFVKFPYNEQILNIIRNQAIRYWLPNTKEWELPITSFENLKQDLKDYKLNIVDNDEVLLQRNFNNEIVNYIPKDFKFKIDPFKHQIEGIEYGLKYDRFILGDEQGLGKTMQAINIATIKKQQKQYKHCLIICGVNGLKWNWKNEIEKHSNEKGYILGTRYKKDDKEYIGNMQDRLDDLKGIEKDHTDIYPYFIITNIETIRNESILVQLKYLCDKKIINMIVLDEGHKCKDPTSQQGKALLKMQTETMITMTGTPLMNNPLDLYIHLRWLGYENHNYYAFKQHYCIFGGYGNYQILGYRHLDQLKSQFEKVMLRRLKKNVLDLPEKIYIDEYVEMSPKQTKIYKEVKAEIKENIDIVINAVNPLTEMIRLRQATDYTGILSSKVLESAKFDRLEEILEEIVANGKKAIIFSNWTSAINPLYDRLQKYNPAIITGEIKDRQEQEFRFMNNDSCKVIVGTTGAMGVRTEPL